MPVLGVERDGEQAFLAPFKAAAAAIGEFKLGRAVAFQNVDDFFVEVTLRARRFARRNLKDEHVGEIAAPLQMHRRTVDAEARPWGSRHVEQINAVVLDERDAFALEPFEIGIDAVTGLGRDLADVHAFSPERRFRAVIADTGGFVIHANSSDLITTGTTPGGAISSPTS